MSETHVIPALRAKRAEISGQIHDLDKRIARMRANLANIDAAIQLLSPSTDPDAIPPKRTYRRTKYFARNELARMALDVLRRAPGPLAAKEIAGRCEASLSAARSRSLGQAAMQCEGYQFRCCDIGARFWP